MTATYTAKVGAENARWLASDDGPLQGTALGPFTDNGDGTVTADDFAFGYLRGLPDTYDGYVSMSEGDVYDRIWIAGDGYEIVPA